MRLILLFFSLSLFSLTIQAQEVHWQTGNGDPCAGTGNSTSNETAPGITITDLCRGTGIIMNAGDDFNSRNFDTDNASCADAIADDECLTWGFSLSGTSIPIGAALEFQLDRSGSGPPEYCLEYDVDGGGYTNLSTGSISASTGCVSEVLPAFADGSTVTFRLCAWGATGSTGTMDIEDGVSSCAGTDGGIRMLSTILPVKMISFTSEVRGDDVLLNWATSNEIDNDYFNIERSNDGFRFESIGRVEGAGNSNEAQDYHFEDDQAISGTSYYRLKQMDFNGVSSYTDILTVKTAQSRNVINVFPTISNDFINITGVDHASAQVHDLNGNVIQKFTIDGETRFDVSELTAGIYLMSIAAADETIVKRIIVQ